LSPIPFADNFLAGSLISLLLPAGLLIAIAIWFARTIKRLPGDAGRSAAPPPISPDAHRDVASAQAEVPSSEA
jgi:hypothetical protein